MIPKNPSKSKNGLKRSGNGWFGLKLGGNGAKSIQEAIGISPEVIFHHIQFKNAQNPIFGANMGPNGGPSYYPLKGGLW